MELIHLRLSDAVVLPPEKIALPGIGHNETKPSIPAKLAPIMAVSALACFSGLVRHRQVTCDRHRGHVQRLTAKLDAYWKSAPQEKYKIVLGNVRHAALSRTTSARRHLTDR
jgi:hypothetical protein